MLVQPGIKDYHHRHTCLWLECILLAAGAANVRTKNILSHADSPGCVQPQQLGFKETTKEALSSTTRNTLATCISVPGGLKGPSFWLEVFLSAFNTSTCGIGVCRLCSKDRHHCYSLPYILQVDQPTVWLAALSPLRVCG